MDKEEGYPCWNLVQQAGASECIVVFSSFAFRDYGIQAYSFRQQFEKLRNESCDLLFIKDPENQWFNHGVRGAGRNIEEVTDFLRKILSPYLKVTFFGSSMGAYATLLFGSTIKPENCVAIAPQLFLEAPFPRYNPQKHFGKYVKLTDLDYSGTGSTCALIGENDIFDVYQSLNLLDNASVRTIFVPGSHHNVLKFLEDKRLFEPLIKSVINGSTHNDIDEIISHLGEESIISSHLSSPLFRLMIAGAVEGYYHNDLPTAICSLKGILDITSNWTGATALLGMSYARLGDTDQALHHLRFTYSANHYHETIYSEFVRLLAKQKLYDEAIEVAVNAMKVNPANRGVMNDLINRLIESNEHELVEYCQSRLK